MLFDDERILGGILAVLAFLLVAYISRNRADIAKAQATADNAAKATEALRFKIADEHPTVDDVNEALKLRLDPVIERLASGSERMKRMDDKLDRLLERRDLPRART